MSRFDRKPTNAAEKPPTEPAQLDPDHIDANNEGFKMLKSMGWTEGEGLGKASKGDALPLSERIKEEARREGLGRAGGQGRRRGTLEAAASDRTGLNPEKPWGPRDP